VVSRKITSVDDLSLKEISSIINKALQYQKSAIQKKTSKPKNIFNLFLEASTRTTISFELAAKKLGHNIINVNFEKSSLSKGETFNDTIDTLISMKPDALIIRDKNNFSPHEIYQKHNIPILNAGDGTNEHPTQAMLDLCVIKSIFKDKKIRIGICGDIKHSRVAHSNIKLLTKLDHEIHIIAPNYFLDKAELTKINKKLVFHKSLSKLPKLDVIMMLRVQKERINRNAKIFINSFKKDFCLNLNHLKNQPYLMHPGPVNRNIEIESKVLDEYPNSLILRQVEIGVYLRMACLDFILK
jgi:aspartate carbamoyltransferase catalytic subunit